MIKIACFETDATPPRGAPLCNGGVKPAKIIVAPLSARGIVILGAGAPIVLCAVDWVGIGGSGHDFWRKALAVAAGTTVDRVTVHTIHPHDAPGHNFSSADLTDLKDILDQIQDTTFAENTVRNAAREMGAPQPVLVAAYGNYEHGYIGTKISYGQGGYETGMPSRVAPESEEVLMATMRELLAP